MAGSKATLTMHIPVVILAEKEADLKNTSLIGLDASIVLDGKKTAGFRQVQDLTRRQEWNKGIL